MKTFFSVSFASRLTGIPRSTIVYWIEKEIVLLGQTVDEVPVFSSDELLTLVRVGKKRGYTAKGKPKRKSPTSSRSATRK